MSIYDWLSIATNLLWLGLLVGIYAGRHWLLARITRGVQHGFDVQIEGVRADLRVKEAEIASLRSSVLGASASRQSMLDKRRFEAVERIWTAVNEMTPFKASAAMMAVLNFDAIAKRASEPKMQHFLDMIGQGLPNMKDFKSAARDEQPFVPETAWAYFSAYTTIVFGSYSRLQVLKLGIENPDQLLTYEPSKKILKAALPQFADFIDKNQPEAYYYLLEHIERFLLTELRNIVEGKEADVASVARGKNLMEALNEVQKETQQASVDFGIGRA